MEAEKRCLEKESSYGAMAHAAFFSFAKVNNNENPWILKDATSKVLNILICSSNTATVLKVANTAPMLLGVRICIGRRGIRDPRDSA